MIKSKFKLITGSLALLISLSVFTGCTGDKTGKLFTTEYDIEDYCENAIIVSNKKNSTYNDLVLDFNWDKRLLTICITLENGKAVG